MRFEESLIVKKIINNNYLERKFKTAVNLGSGNVKQLLKIKPWVHENIFDPLNFLGIQVVNVDAKNFPGVDIVKDLSLPSGLDFIKDFSGPRLLILANVLEHIPASVRHDFLKKIYNNMQLGDSLIITVPNDYPYHADPIDTMYRPLPNELVKLIPLDWKDMYLIDAGSYREEFLEMSLLKRIRKLLKVFLPFQKLSKWLECHRLIYLFKSYKISIVYGVK
jgi:hypothetical protein